MANELDWHDLKLFSAIASGEGLRAAAQRTGASTATLGRRMLALEAAVGRRLFVRGQEGYRLTEAGHVLAQHAREVETAVGRVETWRAGAADRPTVRLSTGTWIAYLLLQRIHQLWQPDDSWTLEFLTTSFRLDVARREADIGVRNRRPEEAWLVGRRAGTVRYAAYGSAAASGKDLPWIGLRGEAGHVPSARWISANQDDQVRLRVSDPRHALDLILSGWGQSILPCFVGDQVSGIERRSEPITELEAEQWVVMHHEARHQTAVRRTVDRTSAIIGQDPCLP